MEYLSVDIDRDLAEINSWYFKRRMRALDPDSIPRIGLIVADIAAGFLISTDTNVGFLEGFVTNPYSPWLNRHIAIDSIAEKLIRAGEEQGMKIFMALTSHPAVIKLCKKYDFKELDTLKVFTRF